MKLPKIEFVQVVESLSKQGPAARARQNLVAAGIHWSIIRNYLAIWAALIWSASTFRHRDKPYGPPGMTRRSISSLRRHLADIATEIEEINGDDWFRPNVFLREPRDSKPGLLSPFGELRLRFRVLPKLIRQYGSYVEQRTVEIGAFRRGPGRGNRAAKNQIIFLLLAVDRATGRPHYREIADLLAAIAPEIQGAPDCNEAALHQLYRRYNRACKRGQVFVTPDDVWRIRKVG
jgi:hypothetical protein